MMYLNVFSQRLFWAKLVKGFKEVYGVKEKVGQEVLLNQSHDPDT